MAVVREPKDVHCDTAGCPVDPGANFNMHKGCGYRRRRLYEKSDAFLGVYRWHAGIEATMSRLKYQMNMANLRAPGMIAMRYVVHLRASESQYPALRRCRPIERGNSR